MLSAWCCYKENEGHDTVKVLCFKCFVNLIKFNIDVNGYRSKVRKSFIDVTVKFRV